jgi:adenine-specific DNA-methyltransferase
MLTVPVPAMTNDQQGRVSLLAQAVTRCREAGLPAIAARLEALINAFVYELFFIDELQTRNLYPFAAAEAAGLMKLAAFEGPALARAANEWSRQLADPSTPLYAALFDLQSLDAVRIIEGR